MVKKGCVIFLLMVTGSHLLQAQNLTGFWKGNLSMRGCFPDNNIEIQIKMDGTVARGDSYHFQDINNYVKKNFSGKYDFATKRLLLQEGMVTTYHIPIRCVICVKLFDLVYSREGDVETLSGSWGGNVLNGMMPCGGGSIVLTRTAQSAFKEIPEVKVDTGTIRLDFYDNAIVDGDSITVKVNNRVVLTHQRLTAKAVTTHVRVDLHNTFHEIEMIAENLGSIPPNTAILIITAGKNQHRLHLSSTASKSARVRIVYEPPEPASPAAELISGIDL